MSMIRRFLAGLFMALVLSSAHSQSVEYRVSSSTMGDAVVSDWFSTRQAAAEDFLVKLDAFNAVLAQACVSGQQGREYQASFFTTYHADGYPTGFAYPRRLGSYAYSSCTWFDWSDLTGSLTYSAREIACTVGASKVLTFGVGWSATGEDDPNEGTWGIPPLSWCDGSCMFSFNDLIGVYMDEEVSANGYYEITATSEYRGTGATCTTPSEPPENPDPEPPCGDGDCTPGDGDGDGPGDGDGGGDPGDGDGDGDDGDTPGGENPGDGAGGDGDGDGENPGDDGPGGGTGPGGDGEGEDEGGGECGIDGKPPCKVKIDESGMPSDATRQAQQSAARTAALGAVDDGASDVSAVLGDDFPKVGDGDIPWLWNVSLPAGACSPISFNTRAITASYNVCSHPLMTAWREAWAYLIGVLGAIYIWRRTTASVGSA